MAKRKPRPNRDHAQKKHRPDASDDEISEIQAAQEEVIFLKDFSPGPKPKPPKPLISLTEKDIIPLA